MTQPTIEQLQEKVDFMEKAVLEISGRFFDYFSATQEAILVTNGMMRKASDTLKLCARNKLATELAEQISKNDQAISAPMPDAPDHWLREMRIAIDSSAKTFREYERLHLVKDSDEGRAKASKNADMAYLCEQAIEAIPGLWKPKSMGGGAV